MKGPSTVEFIHVFEHFVTDVEASAQLLRGLEVIEVGIAAHRPVCHRLTRMYCVGAVNITKFRQLIDVVDSNVETPGFTPMSDVDMPQCAGASTTAAQQRSDE